MKPIYFKALGFASAIPDNYFFHDCGYVKSLIDQTRKLLSEIGQPSDNDFLMRCNISPSRLSLGNGGFHLHTLNFPTTGSRTSWIYYNPLANLSLDIHNRAHEETHAACRLGLKEQLIEKIAQEDIARKQVLRGLAEEDFCDQAGLWVIKTKQIEPNPGIFISYNDRIQLAVDRQVRYQEAQKNRGAIS